MIYHNFDPLYVVPTHYHWLSFCAGLEYNLYKINTLLNSSRPCCSDSGFHLNVWKGETIWKRLSHNREVAQALLSIHTSHFCCVQQLRLALIRVHKCTTYVIGTLTSYSGQAYFNSYFNTAHTGTCPVPSTPTVMSNEMCGWMQPVNWTGMRKASKENTWCSNWELLDCIVTILFGVYLVLWLF